METVLVPAAAGVLSALGLVAADERRDEVRSYVVPLDEAGELPRSGEADLRYAGQSFELTVPLGPRPRRAVPRGARGALRLRGSRARARARGRPHRRDQAGASDRGHRSRACGPAGRRCSSSRARRPGFPTAGPARPSPRHARAPEDDVIDIELQVIGSGLRAIAEEMGAVLVRSAFSANIKERRDCSTALFDEAGRMVTQAEHIPVHLGAMPEAVAAVRAHDPEPGEPWILNDPYAGGTHLPDLTIVTRTSLGYAVTRAHHADVGGAEPGSLPAGSTTLEEEGVVIPPTRLDASGARGSRPPDAQPGRAPRRPARAARGTHARGAAGRRALRPPRARDGSQPRWTSSSPTRSASSARRCASCRTDATRAPTRSRRPTGSSRSALR